MTDVESGTKPSKVAEKNGVQSWPKIIWTTAKIGAVTDTTSNVQPI